MAVSTLDIIRHPDYLYSSTDWSEWRETFAGGTEYRNLYLKRWSDRETETEFAIRKACTPIPTFAKAAILDIRNSIFQRLKDVTRTGGSKSYERAIRGETPGVDRQGTSMASFIGIKVLTELLVMGRVGIYVDAPNFQPSTVAEQVGNITLAPYCYFYRVEDILSWTFDYDEIPGTFKAVLLRDYAVDYCTDIGGVSLPVGRTTRLRLVWKDDNGKVRVRMFNDDADRTPIELVNADSDGAVTLDVPMVPFTMPDIGSSLMADICSYQHALLNLSSGDVNWSLQSSSPFLTIQRDLRSTGSHLKQPGNGTAEPGGQRASDKEEKIGGKGRYYDLQTDRPQYISPPTDPMLASIKLQEKLEDDIRKLVNLAVANKVGSRTESAEAKKLSSQGLEAGLSYIGLVLEGAEQDISKYWAMYEKTSPARIEYPSRYILKQDKERIEEAQLTAELLDKLPSKSARKILAQQIITTLLGGKIESSDLKSILAEIESAGFTTSAVTDVIQAHAVGLVSDKTASEALGYNPDEVEQARKDKAERAKITLLAQTAVNGQSGLNQVGAGARGVPDVDPNPESAKQEKQESRDGE